jgi:hypothetical protein
LTRAIRERPRFAALLGLGVVCLVGLGLLAGALLGGSEKSGSAGERAERIQVRLAGELRTARTELDSARAEIDRLERSAGRQEARTARWRRRAERLERRNRALRRALARERAQ